MEKDEKEVRYVRRDEVELVGVLFVFFCFKQKTAYEIEYGLGGSEMCIRDRWDTVPDVDFFRRMSKHLP